MIQFNHYWAYKRGHNYPYFPHPAVFLYISTIPLSLAVREASVMVSGPSCSSQENTGTKRRCRVEGLDVREERRFMVEWYRSTCFGDVQDCKEMNELLLAIIMCVQMIVPLYLQAW